MYDPFIVTVLSIRADNMAVVEDQEEDKTRLLVNVDEVPCIVGDTLEIAYEKKDFRVLEVNPQD